MCAGYIKRSLEFARDHFEAMALCLIITIWLSAATAFIIGDIGTGKSLLPEVRSNVAAAFNARRITIYRGHRDVFPESCKHKDECSEKPDSFPFDELVDGLYGKKMLMNASGPPPIEEGVPEHFADETCTNDILQEPKYVTIYLLKDPKTKRLQYIIPQSDKHNQTVREIDCNVASPCNKQARHSNYETFVVQKYTRIIMDAVDVRTDRIVKLNYPFKNGCICKYRAKKQG